MMLDINLDKLREGFMTYLPLGLIVGVVMALEMAFVISRAYVLNSPVPEAAAGAAAGNTRELGRVLYTDFAFAFEVAAVILLVAIVSAIALTLRGRKDTKPQNPGEQVRVRAADRMRVVQVVADSDRARTRSEGGK
jgi:NADH-quinone oxidoreductase subunit J